MADRGDEHRRIVRIRNPIPPRRVEDVRKPELPADELQEVQLCRVCGEFYTETNICERCFEEELDQRRVEEGDAE